MLQFHGIKLILLVIVTAVQSQLAFETKEMLPININNQIGSQLIRDVVTENKLLDNVNYISDDKNEANNLFLIEPFQKSLKVFSQQSLLIEHEPTEVIEQYSQQKESQDINKENSKISIQVEKEISKETQNLNEKKQKEEIIYNKKILNSIKDGKIQNKILQSDQKIENNNDNDIIIQDIKIEQLHQVVKSKKEDTQSQNEDLIIIKIDEEIKTTPRIFGVMDNNNQIEQQEIDLNNEKDLEESEQIDLDEFNTINSKIETKQNQQLDKQSVNQEKDITLDEKVNKKQLSNVLKNNKKQQNDKKNKQQNLKVKSTKSKQDGNMDSKDQKLIGELIKVQAESDNVDLNIFENENSDLIPIIIEDSQIPQKSNILKDKSQKVKQNTEKEKNNKQNDIVQDNLNKDKTKADINVDETKFEEIQSELDELARELDQLSQDQTKIQNELNQDSTKIQNVNNDSKNQEEQDSNDTLQYITISTNNDPVIFNSLEDDYYVDDLNNELEQQTLQQIPTINIESKNEQEEVKVFIVNNPEQLVTYKQNNNNEDQFLEDDIQQNGIDTQIQENDVNISIDNNNDDQKSNDNQIQNNNKQSLNQDDDYQGIDELQSENQKFKFNNYEKVEIKKNSQIKKEISVDVDNNIKNENINNNEVFFTNDEFQRIASESEAEIIENLEDLQEEMQAVYQRQIKSDQFESIKNNQYENNIKKYQQKIDENKKQIQLEQDYLDQIRNTQIRDQNQKMKDDEFNKMINDLINEFDYKNQRERDIINYERQITQHIIDNIEELRYAEKILQNDYNELSEEEELFENQEYEQYNDQRYQEAQTQLRRQEFQKQCDDDDQPSNQSNQNNESNQNQAISEYEEEIEKRKKEVIEKIKKELMLKKERLKNNNNNNKKTDNLSSYEFERIYLDWATDKEDIISNILLHSGNSDIEQMTTNHIQENLVQKISKKQEVEEEIKKLYQNYNKNGQHLRGQR
ncbi:unnamed protein product [Paramecium sonneborni]|uniref:Uncharacterized protein n=1 Tax=Paramecium sonneborni TaxID=65129 RepID=A0A8S1PSK6_9CILI|nr:unnamed protein product [Paramecium sonneborni]